MSDGPGTPPVRLLLIEDNPADVELAVRSMRQAGLDCEVAAVATEAQVADALATGVDLVVSDYNVPGFGLERLFQLLADLDDDISVIVVSGVMSEDVVRSAVRMGAVDFLHKDRLAMLGHSVQRALDDAAVRRAHRELSWRLQQIADVAPDVLFVLELAPTRQWRYVSPSSADVLGWSPEELLAVEHVDLDGVGLDLSEGGPRAHSISLPRRDGRTVWLDVRYHVASENGHTRAYGIARDVTIERSMHEQLVQAQKMEAIGRLAGGVAHDFNNLLTAILGFTALVREEEDLPPGVESALEEVSRAGERGKMLVAHLLSLSRHRVSEHRLVDVNEVLRSTESLLRPVIREDISVSLEVTDGPLEVHGDAHQLEQVLINLVLNACDAMPDGGRLVLESSLIDIDAGTPANGLGRRSGPHVLVAVTDSGVGMDAETASRAFEPFFTTKEEGRGTGLGLSTAYSIVEHHRGVLRLYSEPGRGTVLKIYLPVLGADAPPSEDGAEPGDSTFSPPEDDRPGLILLAEDDESVRSLVEHVLTRAGFEVVSASSGIDALARASEQPERIRLLITDVVMPGLGGPELVHALRSVMDDVPVIYMSGYTDQADAARALHAAEATFLAKPFRRDELLEAVHGILGVVT